MPDPREDQDSDSNETEEEERTGEDQAAINRENDPPA